MLLDALPLGLENVGVGSCACICVPSYLCFVYRLHYVLYAFVHICVHTGCAYIYTAVDAKVYSQTRAYMYVCYVCTRTVTHL